MERSQAASEMVLNSEEGVMLIRWTAAGCHLTFLVVQTIDRQSILTCFFCVSGAFRFRSLIMLQMYHLRILRTHVVSQADPL